MGYGQPDGKGGTIGPTFAGECKPNGENLETNTAGRAAFRVVGLTMYGQHRTALHYFNEKADADAACATLQAADPSKTYVSESSR